MENQTSSKGIIVNYGVLLGVVGLLPSLVKYAMGDYLKNDSISSIIGVILMIAFIILGIKKFKSENNGFISWGQGVKIGMGMVLISLIITVLYLLVFSNFIEPEFKNQIMDLEVQKWVEAGSMSQEQMDQSKEMMNNYFYLSMYGAITVMSLFFGFVVAAIVAAIMKKSEENEY